MALDPLKFTTIAHRDHVLCNPLVPGKVDEVLELFDLPPGARVLDVGCGKAEMLMRLIELFGCSAVGVDMNAAFLTEARARSFDRGVTAQLELVESKVDAYAGAPQSFDAALCIGATHAYDGLAGTLAALRGWVKPGGLVLVGEGYWRRKPDPGYLKAIGAKPKDYTEHAGNVEAGLAAKLTYLYAAVSSEDDFDAYEGLYNRAIESYCLENPADPDVDAMKVRIRAWRDAYLRWGRDTLGFGLYLFRAA
jgi:ubiquinone/menaquinone biosynthesis C-methylase UbiE